jgi:AraC-like DNA-binding protein
MSDRFHVSQTHLQNAFKGVYGIPVSSYIRILKMQSAALRLIHTDIAVLEIAAEFGYSNAGKFASAFHRIMGETPGEYRKMHGGLK